MRVKPNLTNASVYMTFDNIVGNGSFAHKEQMLHFPHSFQSHSKLMLIFPLDIQTFHYMLSFGTSLKKTYYNW